ncbi:hypothetical protein [Brucella sp. 2716]|uniref:hypothetical protein n=1 Tax=Brucella sp. 2716 TaxID=2975052 RepID=UPI00217EFC9C|nr:hypothetical protein [Brucella sp. 2716]UWF58986.1 hypothetical protein NYO66_00125 [Brucella sp. 2716]
MTVSELDATLSAAPQLDEPSDEQPTGNERTRIPASSPFNPWRIAATKKAKAIVHEAVEAVEAVEERQKKRRAVDQGTFERAVEAVLCDLMHHHLYQRPGDGIYVSRSKQVLTAKPRYRPPVYTKTFRDILDNLDRAEWIVQEVGEQGRGGTGKRTVVLMSRLLFDKMTSAGITGEDIGSDDRSEVIILKRSKNPDNFWDEGEEIEYRDTEVTAVLRDQMQRINCWLKTADIELDRTWITAPNVGSSDERTLRRIFTNGSFTSGDASMAASGKPSGRTNGQAACSSTERMLPNWITARWAYVSFTATPVPIPDKTTCTIFPSSTFPRLAGFGKGSSRC